MIDVARMFLERGAREEALKWLRLADERQQRPEIKVLRGHAYLELGDLDRAAETAAANPYWNPRPIDQKGLRAMLQDAFDGTAPS